MKLLVLGGTGNISRQIVKQALEKGFEVTMVNRGTRTLPELAGAETLTADRYQKDFPEKFSGRSWDVVIDVICYDEKDAMQDIALFGNRAKQIIFTSSSAVYERPYRTYPVEEDSETLTTSPSFPYAFKKAEMERWLYTQMGKIPAAITILRPSLTFGPGGSNFGMLRQNRNLVRRIREGRPVVTMGESVIPWSFTFTPDLARAYLLCCLNPNTYDNWFQVCTSESTVWEDLYRAVGRAVGREPDFRWIPSALLCKADPDLFQHLFVEKRHFHIFSVRKFRAAVPEWTPEFTLDTGVKFLTDWWEAADFPYDEEKDRFEDALCSAYDQFGGIMEGLRR